MNSGARRGGIFISYRRDESSYLAGRLHDRLVDRFGEAQVFMDVDSLAFGSDFTQVITESVARCAILLVLIGREWAAVTDGRGRRRIDDPDDFVRMEIEAALVRDIRVVPVLVDGAVMPRGSDLPPILTQLARRQALELNPSRYETDIARLIKTVETVLAEAQTSPGRQAYAAPSGEDWQYGEQEARGNQKVNDQIEQSRAVPMPMSVASRNLDVPTPFPACPTTGRFVFVSYAHADKVVVYPELSRIRSLGAQVWYDEGIETGGEWPEEIATALMKAAAVIAMITPNAVASRNVKNEINLALSRSKPILVIHLSKTQLPPGLELQIGAIQAVMRWSMDNDSYARKLANAVAPYAGRRSLRRNRQHPSL
jgi:hypothetical protein